MKKKSSSVPKGALNKSVKYKRSKPQSAKKKSIEQSPTGTPSSTIPAKTLDSKEPTTSGQPLQGGRLILPDVEPWLEPVNGAKVLSQIAQTIRSYVVLPEGAAEAVALWCAHTHVFKAFEFSPRLNISSPEKGCGKTTLRDLTGTLVSWPLSTENLTGE